MSQLNMLPMIDFAMKLVSETKIEGTSIVVTNCHVCLKVRRLSGFDFIYKFQFLYHGSGGSGGRETGQALLPPPPAMPSQLL